jgi:hypothetical protein
VKFRGFHVHAPDAVVNRDEQKARVARVGGAASQLTLTVGCAWATWLTVAVYLVHVLLVCALRPYAVRLELIGQLTVVLCQAAALLLAAMQATFGVESFAATTAAESISTAASTIMTLFSIAALAGAVKRFVRSTERRQAELLSAGTVLEAPTPLRATHEAMRDQAEDDLQLLATLLGSGQRATVPPDDLSLDDLLFDLPPPAPHGEPSAARVAHRAGGFNPLDAYCEDEVSSNRYNYHSAQGVGHSADGMFDPVPPIRRPVPSASDVQRL